LSGFVELQKEKYMLTTQEFDAVPCLDAALTDLDEQEFYHYRKQAVASEIIAENHRPSEDQMASLWLYNTRTGHPTHAGLMLLSREPRKWLPGAYVQFLRFGGRELGDQPIVEKEIGGNLPTMLRQVEELLNVHIDERPVPVSTLREKTVANYPRWALREFFMNAVMHRNYESTQPIRFFWFADRIEIHNPGGLYGEARTDFPRNNAYRNPIIAEILKNLGYVNRYGHGIARAKKELQENGNPEPAFYMRPDVFGVTVWKTV